MKLHCQANRPIFFIHHAKKGTCEALKCTQILISQIEQLVGFWEFNVVFWMVKGPYLKFSVWLNRSLNGKKALAHGANDS